jgi:hypothetical protein
VPPSLITFYYGSTTTLFFTTDIIHKEGFDSQGALLQLLDQIPETWFAQNYLTPKAAFTSSLMKLMNVIEGEGPIVKETRAMTRYGALMEGMADDYRQIRTSYNKKRERLGEKLRHLQSFIRLQNNNVT